CIGQTVRAGESDLLFECPVGQLSAGAPSYAFGVVFKERANFRFVYRSVVSQIQDPSRSSADESDLNTEAVFVELIHHSGFVLRKVFALLLLYHRSVVLDRLLQG